MIRRVAVAAALVVGLFAAWRVISGPALRSDGALRELARAAGIDRRVDGRLTGGFSAGVRRSPTRGATEPASVALLTIASRLQADVEAEPTAAGMAAWGVAELLLDRIDESIRTLEIASAMHESASTLNNLAVAYIARGSAIESADDWPLALQVTERALRIDPGLVEALFNRALVLQRLGLWHQAVGAWQDLLARDASTDWIAEAQLRLQDAEQLATAPFLLTLPDPDRISIDELSALARREPQLAREFADLTLLPQWATAAARGPSDIAQARRSQLDAVSAALMQRGYTALPQHWSVAGHALDLPALAAAQESFAEGLRAFESDRIADSAPHFVKARQQFERLRSPYVRWCDLQLVMVSYITGDTAAAVSRVRELRADSTLRSFPEIDARLHWLEGLFAGIPGDIQLGYEHYAEAARIFEKLGEAENATFLHTLTAEALDLVGDRRLAWRHRIDALTNRRHARNIRRPHTTLLSAAASAISQGWGDVAKYLADEDVRSTEQSTQQLIRVEALLTQARAGLLSGDDGAARHSADQAASVLEGLSPALRQRYAGDVLAVRARFDGPDADVLSLEAARLLEQQGGALRVPDLLLHAARIRLGRGDRAGSAAVLDDAIKRLTSQVPHSVDSLRWSYADSVWPVFRQAALLRLERGDLPGAIDIAEHGRLSRSAAGADVIGRLQAGLNDSTTVVRFIVGPDRVHAVIIRRSTVHAVQIALPTAQIDTLIKQYIVEAGGELSPSPRILKALTDAIVQPLLPSIPDGDRLVIVPDGSLHHVALGGARLGDGRFLIERNAIEIWTSLEPDAAESRHDSGRHLVALGLGTFRTLPPLTDAERESSDVASMYSGRVLLGASATAESLKSAATGADILHFSTHALANPEFPNLSWIALSPDILHPQGLVFAHEIRQMDLRHVALVYLSTCDGARGQLSRSEGAASLARAFLDAGAGAVIASGWRINDAVAHELSVSFHRRFAQGDDAADALRAAQRDIARAPGNGLTELGWSSIQLYRKPTLPSRSNSQALSSKEPGNGV